MDTATTTAGGRVGRIGECHVLLRGGRVVALRSIRPSDRDLLVQFHEGLSAEAVSNRFFNAHPHLSPVEVRHFTELDKPRRGATVALHDGRIVGVGRYEPTDDVSTAELGLVVADDFQGAGLGAALLRVTARGAARDGYDRLLAQVLSTNYRMLRLLVRSGYERTMTNEGQVTNVLLDIAGVED